jgi:hypothetical protein
MGNLVFQATLGGQVNLVGPNTASTYNINVPAVAGTMVTTGDTGSVSSTMLASSLSLTTPNIGVATGTSLKVSAGFYSTSSSSFTYTDGIVMDYTTGLGRISVGTSDGLAFYNAGVATTELMRLDASGNLGLGVTPSAWASPFGSGVLELSGAYIVGLASSQVVRFGQNHYYNGSNYVYKANGPASALLQNSGAFQFYNAPSGTAGNAITFTQAMTLDSSGNLLVGTTSAGTDKVRFASAGNTANQLGLVSTDDASGNGYIQFRNSAGTSIGSITRITTTNAVAYNTTSDHRLKNNVRPADAKRFMEVEFVDFEWVDGRHDCGVIADKLQAIYPDLVIGEKDATEVREVEITPAVLAVLDEEGNEITPAVLAVTEEQTFPKYQQVNYIGLIPRMGTVIQQQQRLIESLISRIEALEAK